MVLVQDILVSDEVLREHFRCNLNACKGACCWEGDFGAPLESEEMETLEKIYGRIKPFLRQEGIEAIDNQGLYVYYANLKGYGTPLLEGGACAYLTFEKNGVAKCGIEKACEAGITTFKKPISCHLYPVRVSKNEAAGFEALNYDQWDICSAACTAGKKEKLPVFRFVKDALVRKYGEDFFAELEAAAEYLGNDK
ncbi:MAG: DUF3109 family protein [Bacteroidetes bacterium]|nr:DUF3109 family protein [Bacteroidota bacterium]